jgi:predicted cupin superfamily sugar epimerase
MNTIEDVVRLLQLKPHPEGGFYAETYRSPELIKHGALPQRFGGDRNFSTAIYFLLPAGVFSAFHRIQADECWHFYEGSPLTIYVINEAGELSKIRLGRNITDGQVFQAIVPAGCWFASIPDQSEGFSLVGCTVAPGFDFADFELADADVLSANYPKHTGIIKQLCRQ